MTSVMSGTGEPEYGQSSPEALAVLMSPPASSRDEYVENHLKALTVYGSKPEWQDDEHNRARARAAYDRCFFPAGLGRQMRAIMRDGSRADALRKVNVPTLVLHGSRDTLIDASGGRRTAELIPGATYVEFDGTQALETSREIGLHRPLDSATRQALFDKTFRGTRQITRWLAALQ